MTFEQWWTSDENRWSDTRYVKKVAEMAWEAGHESAIEEVGLTEDLLGEVIFFGKNLHHAIHKSLDAMEMEKSAQRGGNTMLK